MITKEKTYTNIKTKTKTMTVSPGELNKYKWVHPHRPLGLIYPTNAAILHREEKID